MPPSQPASRSNWAVMAPYECQRAIRAASSRSLSRMQIVMPLLSPCPGEWFHPEWAAESSHQKDLREMMMLTDHDELGAWLRLLCTPGIGPQTARQLLAAFGPPQAVWQQSLSAWQQVVGPRTAQAMGTEPEDFPVLLKTTWNWLHNDSEHRAVVTLGDADYPAALLQTEDPPGLL